jgi:ATP-binding cassette subfamily B (MDR/TAP) protein 1
MFVIAILALLFVGSQNIFFGITASTLTARLRSLSFKAMLRQDSKIIQNREQPKILN